MSITLTTTKGEPRVDSRLVAQQLGNKARSVIVLIDRFSDQFKQLGVLAFQMTKPSSTGGRPERYALLNEDQAVFLLTLSKNSPQVVSLKAKLVAAFREARDRTSVASTQYLPLYHALHDEVAALARRALECGSTTSERVFHMNINKALNAATGVARGKRGSLSIEQQLFLTMLQAVYRRTLSVSLANGDDHRTALGKIKNAGLSFMTVGHDLLLTQNTSTTPAS